MPYNYGNYNNGYSGFNLYNNQTALGRYDPGMYQTAVPMQQMQQASYQAPPAQMPQNNNGIKWVQGRSGANAYPLNPGESALLMDSEEAVLYVKTVDQTGRPLPLEEYDLVRRENVINVPATSKAAESMSEYVKKSELEDVVSEAVRKAIERMTK